MPSIIRKQMSIDMSASTLSEDQFNIALPDGFCVEVLSVEVHLAHSTAGTAQLGVFAGLAAEPTAITSMTPSSIEGERAIISVGSLIDNISGSARFLVGSTSLALLQDPYAIDLRALVGGGPAVVVGAATLEALFIVEYETRKITTSIASALAGK